MCVSRDCPIFSGTPYYLRNVQRGKLQISNLASTFRGSIRIKAHEKFWRKGSGGVSRDCPNFLGTPYYLTNGESYGFQILRAHLWAQSEQKPIKNWGKSSRGRCQGLRTIFRAPIHRAHRAVIFAIAQLSCLLYNVISLSYNAVVCVNSWLKYYNALTCGLRLLLVQCNFRALHLLCKCYASLYTHSSSVRLSARLSHAGIVAKRVQVRL